MNASHKDSTRVGWLPEADVIRVIAAASVIAIHTTSRYVNLLSSGFAWNQAMRYAVPLFIIMSGFLLENSELHRGDRPQTSAWPRIKRLLPPYIAWTLIYTVLDAILDPLGFASLVQNSTGGLAGMFVRHLLMGSGAVHLYFIVIIVQLYFVFPVMHSWIEKRPSATLITAFLVSFYFQAGEYLYAFGVYIVPKAGLSYYGILFVDWVFYFVLGIYVRHRIDRIKPKLRTNTLRFALLWVASFGVLYVDTMKTYNTSLKPAVMLYAVISYLFFYSVCVRAEKLITKVSGVTRWLSEQSFGIYLSHILVLRLLDEWGLTPAPHGGIEGILGMGFIFVQVTLISVLFCYLVSISPLAELLGATRSSLHPASPK